MCLPVLFPATVRIETVGSQILDECDASFHMMTPPTPTPPPSTLSVVTHAAWDYVVVTRPEDVPERFRPVPDAMWELLTYNVEGCPTGLLLLRLIPGLVSYEPLAISHRMLARRLVLPLLPGVSADTETRLYTICTPMAAHTVLDVVPNPTNAIRWESVPAEYGWGPARPLRRVEVCVDEELPWDGVVVGGVQTSY